MHVAFRDGSSWDVPAEVIVGGITFGGETLSFVALNDDGTQETVTITNVAEVDE